MKTRALAPMMGAVSAAIASAFLTQDHGWVIGSIAGGAIGVMVALLVLVVTRNTPR
jgi:hypothetical protein